MKESLGGATVEERKEETSEEECRDLKGKICSWNITSLEKKD